MGGTSEVCAVKEKFNGPYIVQDGFDGWDCEQNVAVLERDDSDQVVAVWHVCPCGCKGNRRLPVNGHKQENGAGWSYSVDERGYLTMNPSLQDYGTCNSHYFIREGMVQWC